MIRANCQEHFKKSDFEFLLSALTKYKSQRPALEKLMIDPEVMDQLLDNRTLIHEVLDRFSMAQISPYLFFYIMFKISMEDDQKYNYLVDLLEALDQKAGDMILMIHSHIGNYAL